MRDWAPLEEYLKPLGVGQAEAAQKLGVLLNRLNEIVLGSKAHSCRRSRKNADHGNQFPCRCPEQPAKNP